MSEFKEIDLNTLQKVEVRNHESQDWVVAYYLNKSNDGNIRAILEDGAVIRYSHCRPYKEPTKRPMTDREIFNALKKEDCWLRVLTNEDQIDYWITNFARKNHEITYDAGETWDKLEVEDV